MNMHTNLNPAEICTEIQRPWEASHVPLSAYAPTPDTTRNVASIVDLHRQRQSAIRAKNRITLAMKAVVRSMLCSEEDFEEDKSTDKLTRYGKKPRKLTAEAKKRVDGAVSEALKEIKELGEGDESTLSPVAREVLEYTHAEKMFQLKADRKAREMVKIAKLLPAYEWAASVHGFGDVSFATIVGECGDIGTYKSIASVWKRLGLAVDENGRRQGNPGEGATAQDWVKHGYNKARRSVSWNARNGLIGPNGLWRPDFGANVDGSNSMTEYQCVFTKRARYASEKKGLPISCVKNAKGVEKESYKAHVINDAARYMEKRLIKNLYIEWRKAA